MDLRKRYVKSAAYFIQIERSPFKESLKQRRSAWNARYSDHPLDGRASIPNGLSFADQRALLPPSLTEQSAYPRDRFSFELAFVESEWSSFVFELCSEWWPINIFPNWMSAGSRQHPAWRFVAASLIWEEVWPEVATALHETKFDGRPRGATKELAQVFAEYFIDGGLYAGELDYDPTDPSSHPEVILCRERHAALLRSLELLLEQGSRITAAGLDRLDQRALQTAMETRAEIQARRGPGAWAYQRRFPATYEQDQALKAEALRRVRDGCNNWSEVAGRLGIDRRTLRDWVDPPTKRRAQARRST